MHTREIERIIRGMPTSDGAGVKLTRSLGARPGLRFDPFLMLDEFASDEAVDYIGGFPSHPHRGFQTVTYMLDGHMRHEDHMGNQGDLQPGDVQWMVAGRGIIHSEMPQQTQGRMRGFQLWINLPAAEKMQPATYRDVPAAQIPVLPLPGGGQIKLIAGELDAVQGPIHGLSMRPLLADIWLQPGERYSHKLAPELNAGLYVYEGSVKVAAQTLDVRTFGVLGAGDAIELAGGAAGGRVLLLAGKPIGEPVEQYGPFVMNTREEIEQALQDYSNGTLAA
jgi:redox-sensitive bicupin YhaK (pirin superfamily)